MTDPNGVCVRDQSLPSTMGHLHASEEEAWYVPLQDWAQVLVVRQNLQRDRVCTHEMQLLTLL